ncbi:MAG: DUF421 domain-containing protein [Nitrospiraceae bacterium]
MDAVFRAFAIYIVLLFVFRIAGRRTMAELTSFDFVLLLLISEATQNALLGNDFSVTNGILVILTLVMTDIVLSLGKARWSWLERWLDGMPMIIVENGRALKDRMRWSRVDQDDVMAAARTQQGLERMDQIKYAVLEVSGGISIIPK